MAVAPADDAFVLAGHGRRLAAALLDGVLATFIVGGLGAAGFGIGLLGAEDSDSDGWEALGWLLFGSILGLMVGVVVWLVLTVWLVRRPGARNGQTVGKQFVGIRAARVDHSEIGVGWGLLREILAKGMLVGATSSVVSTMLGFVDAGAIGALVAIGVWYGPALADDQRRGLHDRLCGTRVIVAGDTSREPPPASDDDLWPATA